MCTYGAFIASPTPAPQSQPTIGTPLLATEQDTTVTKGGSWFQYLIIFTIVLCLLYYRTSQWRKQQEANDNYEVVELESSKHAAGAGNEHSDNPLIPDAGNNIATKA